MSSSANNNNNKKVKNPYLKASSSSSAKTHEHQTIGTTAAAKITPDERLDNFFVPKTKDVKRKPHDVRKLVPPTLDSSDDENSASSSSLYYHSDDHTKKAKVDEQGHIHASLDYHHRGEMPLDQSKLKAYRFIRNNFLIPSDIEENAKFGPHSGQCFEERVIRAYTLDQLKPKKSHEKSTTSGGGSSSSSLFVCSYCGDEGHKRDGCLKLL